MSVWSGWYCTVCLTHVYIGFWNWTQKYSGNLVDAIYYIVAEKLLADGKLALNVRMIPSHNSIDSKNSRKTIAFREVVLESTWGFSKQNELWEKYTVT
jgi:hypothetical protein